MKTEPDPFIKFSRRLCFPGFVISVILFLITGCIHIPAPHLPQSWIGTPVDWDSLADDPGQAKLQIIIAYGQLVENHSALRLVCPDRQVIFWDPGGGYNAEKAPHTRWNDLIVEDPPDLKTYMKFREIHYDLAVEIFEWNLEIAQAKKMHDVLKNGTDNNHPAGIFRTNTLGLFCSTAVSDFLKRFATDIMTVPDTYFRPNKLARVLYSQSPDRVLIFRRNQQPLVYIQPPKTMRASPSTDRTIDALP